MLLDTVGAVMPCSVLKGYWDAMVFAGGEELDEVHDFSFHVLHGAESAIREAADGGVAMAGDDRRGQEREVAESAGAAFFVGFGS